MDLGEIEPISRRKHFDRHAGIGVPAASELELEQRADAVRSRRR